MFHGKIFSNGEHRDDLDENMGTTFLPFVFVFL
jgi:hypothetical protein